MSKKTARHKQDPIDFETALKELESIVQRMEQGEQTLEQSLQDFERGMTLSKQCQESLKTAQLRIETMMTQNTTDQPCADKDD